MSRHGETTFAWADGEYTFRLGLGELRRLQEKTGAGPYELLRRLATGVWRVDDMRETIRLGLQGGHSVLTEHNAIDDLRINRLIEHYVDNRPLLSGIAAAVRVLEAALLEPEDDPVPKSPAAEGTPPSSPRESSPSPSSTDGDRSSDTPPRRSTRSRSGSSAAARPATRPRKAAKPKSSRRAAKSSTP